ncbi:MAG TPA: biopolymer transporter ExbD [Candidatus Methylacidiphilales bacterium]|nr:biopolymer transporter ExbD [Candidatus Methylacidiphilales bacterium]
MAFVLIRRLQPLRGLIDLVPVVTVILLLLSFFLLSSSFVLQSGIKVEPPPSEFGVGTPSSRLIVAVTLGPQLTDASGAPLPRVPMLYFNDQIVTLSGLRDLLDKLPLGRLPPPLVIKADKGVTLDTIISIEDVASAHRLPVVLATQPMTGAALP